jgi:hypothetical protein
MTEPEFIKETNKTYVSYLRKGDEFNKDLITTNLECTFNNKPTHAWWGSPEDADYGWKEWCISEEYGNYDFDKPIRWKLKEGSKIFTIDLQTVTQVPSFLTDHMYKKQIDFYIRKMPLEKDDIKYLLHNTTGFSSYFINFEKLKDDGITAVELTNASVGHIFLNGFEIMFNSWDCESIVVLDETKIEFL